MYVDCYNVQKKPIKFAISVFLSIRIVNIVSSFSDGFISSSHDEESKDCNDVTSDRIDSEPIDLAAGTKLLLPDVALNNEADADHAARIHPDLNRILEDATESGNFPVNSIVNCESFCPCGDDGKDLHDLSTSILQTDVELRYQFHLPLMTLFHKARKNILKLRYL